MAKYCQGDKTVQEYQNRFLTPMDRKYFHDSPFCTFKFPSICPKLQEESHISRFLMNLRPEFEQVWTAPMNQEITIDLDMCTRDSSREDLTLILQYYHGGTKAFITPPEDTALLTACAQSNALNARAMGMWLAIARRKNYERLLSKDKASYF